MEIALQLADNTSRIGVYTQIRKLNRERPEEMYNAFGQIPLTDVVIADDQHAVQVVC